MATDDSPDGVWLRDGSLVYKLKNGVNCDEINISMVNGSRNPEQRELQASIMQHMLNRIDVESSKSSN